MSQGSERPSSVDVIKCVVLLLMGPELLDQTKESSSSVSVSYRRHCDFMRFLFLGVQKLTDEEATLPCSKVTPIAGRNFLEFKYFIGLIVYLNGDFLLLFLHIFSHASPLGMAMKHLNKFV